MKAFSSNTRQAFAYQDTEANCANLNPALDGSGTRFFIRVVQPGGEYSNASTSRNTQYDGESESVVPNIAADRIVSAYVSKIYYYQVGSVGSTFVEPNPTQEVFHVQAEPLNGNLNILDIQIKPEALDAISDADNLGRALIVLIFESGVTETLGLYLKDPNKLFVNIEPEHLNIVTHNSDQGIQTGAQPLTITPNKGGLPEGGKSAVSYSIAKTYREVNRRGSGNNHMVIGGAYADHGPNARYYTYGQPWGFFLPEDPVNGGTNAALNGTAFGTTTPSTLKWFTGNSDMSHVCMGQGLYAESQFFTNTSDFDPESALLTGSVGFNLSKFFTFGSLIGTVADSATGTSDGNASTVLQDVLPARDQLSWGQKFGWYSDCKSVCTYLEETGVKFTPSQIYMNGVPISPVPLGHSAFEAGYDEYDYDQEMAGFNGDFTNPTQNARFNGDSTADGSSANGPQMTRSWNYCKANYQAAATASTIKGPGISVSHNAWASAAVASNASTLVTSSNNIYRYSSTRHTALYNHGAYVLNNNLLNLQYLQHLNAGIAPGDVTTYPGGNANGIPTLTTIGRVGSGSARSIISCTSNSKNFFYAGGIGGREASFEPIFKGIIRVTYGDATLSEPGENARPANLQASVGRFLSQAAINAGHANVNGVDMVGVNTSTRAILNDTNLDGSPRPAGSITRNYNPIDLVDSMLYANMHENGRIDNGIKSDANSNLINEFAAKNITGENNGTFVDSAGASLNYNVAVQDIAFLNASENGYRASGSGTAGSKSQFSNALAPIWDMRPENSTAAPNLYEIINNNASEYTGLYSPVSSFPYNDIYSGSGFDNTPPIPLPFGQALAVASGNSTYRSSVYGETANRFENPGVDFATAFQTHPINGTDFAADSIYNLGGFSPGIQRISIPKNGGGINAATAVATAGEGECFSIIGSAVRIKRTDNGLLASAANNVSATLFLRFVNRCSGDIFKAADSTIATTEEMTKAQRVTHVLEVFPHIEYHPLPAMHGQSTQNPAGLAYKTIVGDADDVDDIRIDEIGPNEYLLKVEISQGDSDIFNNPDDDFPLDAVVPGVDLWLDTPMTDISSEGDLHDYSNLYAEYKGPSEYSYYKGSFFTVAHTSDWETAAEGTADNEYKGPDYTGEELIYHHTFLTYGTTPSDFDEIVDQANLAGCTDATADNYNPDAVIDDGGCISCNDNADGTVSYDLELNGLGSIKAGVYDSSILNVPAVAGALASSGLSITQLLTFSPGQPEYAIYNSQAAIAGGAISCTNDFFNEAATGVSLSITTPAMNTGGALTEMLSYLSNTHDEDHTMWKLKIKPFNEDAADVAVNGDINALDNFSYSSTNPMPSDIEDITAIYTSEATGGSIYKPSWNDITVSGLESGKAYFLELSMEPKTTPVACTLFNADKAKSLSIMWVTFCSCATVGNDYFNLAMTGNGYSWQTQTNQSFPILSYSGAASASCGTLLAGLAGDNPYGNAAGKNICFQFDQQTDTCDNYFLYCVAQTETSCATLPSDITFSSLGDFAYVEGDSFYLPYDDVSVTVNIEGVYNGNANGYIFNPDLEYTISVHQLNNDTGEYSILVDSVTNGDAPAIAPGTTIIQHVFEGLPGAGEYQVTWVFTNEAGADANSVYPEGIGLLDTEYPCTYTETFVILPPSSAAGCPEITVGCTNTDSPNYDNTAEVDDGSCEPPIDPCIDVWNNPNISMDEGITATNSDSTCEQDTFVVSNVEYTANTILPSNNGSVEVTATYNPAGEESTLAVYSFALLLFPTTNSVPGLLNVIDSASAIFTSGSYPTTESIGTTVINNGVGYYSPLFQIADQSVSQDFEHTFENLPPGQYFLVAIPSFNTAEDLDLCTGTPFITLQDQITTVSVGLNDPAEACEQPCLGTDCIDYVLGCTDPSATNYEPTATYDDGTCQFDVAFCEQPANADHPLCVDCDAAESQPSPTFISTSKESGRSVSDTLCDPVTGADGECTDPDACNYNPDAAVNGVSNNQLCDYCSCDDGEDPSCNEDADCDPELDPDCEPFEPECPDPGNPLCDPVIYDPCPGDDCGPATDPCLILGNCGEGSSAGDPVEPVVEFDEPTIQLTCFPEVQGGEGINTGDESLDQILETAFQCMSEEGKKMMFKMKAGAEYEDVDLLKLSLVSYLLNGGSEFTDLPCLFNCNYDSPQKDLVKDSKSVWAGKGARFWNTTDTFQKGQVVVYYYLNNGRVTRNFYEASRTITPLDIAPRYQGSGWHRIITTKVRTEDTNGIATGNENYLQTFVEFMTRHCQSCVVKPRNPEEASNNVDPELLQNYLDPKTNKEIITRNPSGILGEDGDEIIF